MIINLIINNITMIEYLKRLSEEPSNENLSRVNHEMCRAQDILVNYHFLLSQITKDCIVPDSPEILKIRRQIENEELLIKECREVAAKIEEALKAKK